MVGQIGGRAEGEEEEVELGVGVGVGVGVVNASAYRWELVVRAYLSRARVGAP